MRKQVTIIAAHDTNEEREQRTRTWLEQHGVKVEEWNSLQVLTMWAEKPTEGQYRHQWVIQFDDESRLQVHRSGHGARLLEVVGEAGISWEVSRLWKCDTYEEARALERKLKHAHGHGPALCPYCSHRPLDAYTSLRQGHWPIALHNKRGRRSPVSTSKPPVFGRIERQVLR